MSSQSPFKSGVPINHKKTMVMRRNIKEAQEHKYMDKMSEALNKNIEKNIFPHWRNHKSIKGKHSKKKITGQVGVQ